jgi:peptide/nickel transport system substrate-binding protein
VVVGGTSLAGAAAILAACGGGDSGGGSGGQSQAGRLFTDDKEEGTPVKGGTYKYHIGADLSSLDPFRQSAASTSTQIGTFAMNRLMQWKQGPGIDPFSYTLAPDLATSYEVSDGGTTYTFKLRQGVKFHNVAPVNGRVFDSEDVTWSYKRFSTGVAGVGNVNAGNTGAPQFGNSFKGLVDSVTAPDKNTVVFKLSKPNAAFLNIAATYLFFWIYPKEADAPGGYDPLKTTIGTGPWIVSNYVPSARIEYKKNPEYYEAGLPYMDAVQTFFIGEAAQQIAQFQAGSIFQYTPTSFADFQSMASDPKIRVISNGYGGSQGIGFNGVQVNNPNAPYLKDARVRQAVSMAIDRQLILESFNDIDKYKGIGIDRSYKMANFIEPNLSAWYVDPRSKEMGDAAQYYMFDVAKAKQLMSAAGQANGFDVDWHYSSNNATDQYLNLQPFMAQALAQIGIRAKLLGEDYASVFNPHSWHGESDGISNWTWQAFGDPGQQLDYLFGATSTRNQMGVNDPKFNAMYDQQQAELDNAKRKQLLLPLLQYLQTESRHIGWGYGTVDSYTLYQPQVKNNKAYANAESGGQRFLHWYLSA